VTRTRAPGGFDRAAVRGCVRTHSNLFAPHACFWPVSVAHVELGNELYWGKHASTFPNGTSYGRRMRDWASTIRAAGYTAPGTRLYMTLQDTPGVGSGSRLGTWNDEALLAAGVTGTGGAGDDDDDDPLLGGVFHVYRSVDARLVAGFPADDEARTQWGPDSVQQYTFGALGTTEGLAGYIGMPQWNDRHDPYLSSPLLKGRPTLVSEFNIVEHSGGGLRMSWAHGMYVAGTVLSLWQLPFPPVSAMVHVLSGPNGGFGWAAIFTDDNQLDGACCGRNLPTKPWALTAEGAAMGSLAHAARGSKAMATLNFSVAGQGGGGGGGLGAVAYGPLLNNPSHGINLTFAATTIAGVAFFTASLPHPPPWARDPANASAVVLLNTAPTPLAVQLGRLFPAGSVLGASSLSGADAPHVLVNNESRLVRKDWQLSVAPSHAGGDASGAVVLSVPAHSIVTVRVLSVPKPASHVAVTTSVLALVLVVVGALGMWVARGRLHCRSSRPGTTRMRMLSAAAPSPRTTVPVSERA
jgi:hypothetical protein